MFVVSIDITQVSLFLLMMFLIKVFFIENNSIL